MHLVDVMHKTSVGIIRSRTSALEEDKKAMNKQVGRGKDIMSILSETCCCLSCVSFSDK